MLARKPITKGNARLKPLAQVIANESEKEPKTFRVDINIRLSQPPELVQFVRRQVALQNLPDEMVQPLPILASEGAGDVADDLFEAVAPKVDVLVEERSEPNEFRRRRQAAEPPSSTVPQLRSLAHDARRAHPSLQSLDCNYILSQPKT
ncbi:hypothetical protein [Methylorubrum zatmanii]|uniref:Uncharacterized protein n=1 Tax=Methylorubrum zatmanii TaxID=29429 RepID=A0ABW1WK14_9HYPH|nr:hypothetical protein [Methylorubrum zatmanii]